VANELKSALNGGRRLRYQDIREQIRREIEERRYAPGERLPSDTELAGRFSVSRLTVIRALRELESQALVQRKAGSGTFVRVDSPVVAESSYVFGLLMPDLGDGEIFEPVARGIARAGESLHHRLLWGNDPAAAHDKEQQADELCRYLVAREVSGVFFSPVEHTSHQESVNQRIAEALTAAGIPIVLIDRCICRYPDRSPHDLIGIDNPRAGSRMTRHLIQAGCRRVVFASRPARLEALPGLSLELENDQSRELRAFLAKVRPDGLVCANDFTAAKLMQALLRLGVRIPEDIKMVGINDVKYAGFLPVPLTTLRQPCQELGATAMAVMLDRLERPASPVRDVLLDCELIVRQSCGAK
jgi:DNA-binding LacI/PurR family transcriptional regulator